MQQAIDDSRLRSGCVVKMAPPGESRPIIRYVADCKPLGLSVFAQLCENMTSSTKPKIHDILVIFISPYNGSKRRRKILHCRQRKTEPRPQVARTEIVMKFGRIFFRISSGQTYPQTYRHTSTKIAPLPGAKLKHVRYDKLISMHPKLRDSQLHLPYVTILLSHPFS